MPIYAYRCESCGHAKDVLQKMSDEPLSVCPACGEPTFRKQVTAAGFQLKGSGWYVTDFRDGNKGGGKPAEKEDGKPAGGEAKEAGKDAPKDGAKPASDSPAAAAAPSSPSPAPSPAPTPAAPGASATGKGPSPGSSAS